MNNKAPTYFACYKIGVLCLAALSVFLFIQYIRLSDKNIAIQKERNSISAEKDMVLEYFWQRIFVPPDRITIHIDSDLYSSIAGNSHLALWISDKHCSECVNFILAILHKLPDQVKSKIIIFSDYQNPRLRKIINEKISGDFHVFDYKFPNVGTLYNFPFIGIVSPNLEVSKIFFPAKELPQLTDYYLARIFDYIIK
jgi:hypothetical protein